MKLVKACEIFTDINNADYRNEEKWEAVCEIIDMATHNSITKDAMVNAMRWMVSQIEEEENE